MPRGQTGNAKGHLWRLESRLSGIRDRQSHRALLRIQVGPADKLSSRGKEPSLKGQQSRQSGAEQQKRAASIRHATAISRTIIIVNGITDQANEAILC